MSIETAAPTHEDHSAAPRRSRGLRSLKRILGMHLTAADRVPAQPARPVVPVPERVPATTPEAPQVALHYYTPSKHLNKKGVNIGYSPPMLSAEEVKLQTELDLGPLKAVISLPQPQPWIPEDYRTMRLFCFEQEAPTGRHSKAEPSYVFLTSEQLTQMRAAARTGDAALWEAATQNAATIDAKNPSLQIGRGSWLPNLGNNLDQLDDPRISARYETISRDQVTVSMDEQGGLRIEDLGSKNGTNIYFTPIPPSQEALNASTGQFGLAA